MRVSERDLIRGEHYGQRSCEPHSKAEHMAAPTNTALVRKSLPTRSDTSGVGGLSRHPGAPAVSCGVGVALVGVVDCYRLAGERRPVIPTAWRHQSVYGRLPRPDLEWSGLTLQNWLLAREASHVPDRALGLKAVVVLPFEQPVGALVHSQSVVAIDLVRQRGAVDQHLLHNGYKLRSDSSRVFPFSPSS
jgi:hypothetical protein